MPGEKIKNEHLDLIADRIFECRCVPFLGAGANASSAAHNYEGLRLGPAVAGELIKMIEYEGSDPSNLPRVALQYEIKKDRLDLVTKLKTILPEDKCEPSPLLKTLSKLPFRLIVTTNYDRLLERSLDGHKEYVTIIQSTDGILIQTPEGVVDKAEVNKKLEELEIFKGLLIYKLHGTFQPADDDSPIIVTEDDYIHFLTVAGMESIGVPRLITKRITPNTLLFLGYSLEDWDFRTIYRGLIKTLSRHQKRQSFAIQQNPAEYWVEFWKEQKVKIYDMDLYDFAEQLEARYFKMYGKVLDENKCLKS